LKLPLIQIAVGKALLYRYHFRRNSLEREVRHKFDRLFFQTGLWPGWKNGLI
jgi:hypothetical protein